MTKFSFSETYKSAEKQYNLGKGEYFKVQEGANRIRLVSICLPHDSTYQGKPQFKWLCQIIDRKDGKVKPYFMPTTVYKAIEALQTNPDYAFDDIPMPYDITINAKGAGTKEVDYTVMPSPKLVPLTAEEQKALSESPTVQELQGRIRESEKEEQGPTPAPAGVVAKATAVDAQDYM